MCLVLIGWDKHMVYYPFVFGEGLDCTPSKNKKPADVGFSGMVILGFSLKACYFNEKRGVRYQTPLNHKNLST